MAIQIVIESNLEIITSSLCQLAELTKLHECGKKILFDIPGIVTIVPIFRFCEDDLTIKHGIAFRILEMVNDILKLEVSDFVEE